MLLQLFFKYLHECTHVRSDASDENVTQSPASLPPKPPDVNEISLSTDNLLNQIMKRQTPSQAMLLRHDSGISLPTPTTVSLMPDSNSSYNDIPLNIHFNGCFEQDIARNPVPMQGLSMPTPMSPVLDIIVRLASSLEILRGDYIDSLAIVNRTTQSSPRNQQPQSTHSSRSTSYHSAHSFIDDTGATIVTASAHSVKLATTTPAQQNSTWAPQVSDVSVRSASSFRISRRNDTD